MLYCYLLHRSFLYLFLLVSLKDCAVLEDNYILLKSCGCWGSGEWGGEEENLINKYSSDPRICLRRRLHYLVKSEYTAKKCI